MRFAVLLVIAACGSKSTSESNGSGSAQATAVTCDQVAEHVKHLFAPVDDYANTVGETFRARCKLDGWAEPGMRCIMETVDIAAPKNCADKLLIEQRTNLKTALANIEPTMVPPACKRYEGLLELVKTCDAMPQAIRDDLRAKLEAAKKEWEKLVDKRELGGVCNSAITSVKAAARDCPGVDKW